MASDKLVLAIDAGTTSNRAILFDAKSQIVAVAQEEFAQIMPQQGWVEHDPSEIWATVQRVVAAVLADGAVAGRAVAAVGITNQRETTVVWDAETGEPLHNALVWMDTRTSGVCAQLIAEGGAEGLGKDRFRAKTGLPIATYFSGTKLRWLLENVPAVRDAAAAGRARAGTVDAWLVWKLTGGAVHATDVSNASRTMLMDLATLDWDEGLLAAFGVARALLPAIKPSSSASGAFGSVDAGACGDGFAPLAGVPIAGVLGDQQAALFGQACFDVGNCKNTYGTGCFTLMNTGAEAIPSTQGLLTTVGYQLEGQGAVYCLEGSVAIAGALVQWLRDSLELIPDAPAIEPLAASAPGGGNGGVYFVPAFSGLYAPYWREDARGAIVGLTRFATKAHLARAVLEASAFQSRELLDAMERDAGTTVTEMKVDGGMTANGLLMQFQADLLGPGCPVVRPVVAEATALGAAYAAGLGAGVWGGLDELRGAWREAARWTGAMDEAKRAGLYRCWKKAVTRTFGWVDKEGRDAADPDYSGDDVPKK